jgi:predicted O-linked N-acetylglucosamine transferase (SPINDLY family)
MSSRSQALARAAAALAAGDPAAAIRLCRKQLRKKGSDSDALRLLAHALLRGGQPRQALAEAERLVRVAPGRAENLLLLGHLQLQCGAAAAARQSLEQAVAIAPGEARAWHELALARRPAGDPTAVVAAFARAHELEPASDLYRDNHCQALIEAGACKEAERICRAALVQAPASANLHHVLGQALFWHGEFGAAREALERAHALAPADPFVVANLGACLVLDGERQRGIELLRRAMASPAASPSIHGNLINALAESGQAEAALEELRRRHPPAGGAAHAEAVVRVAMRLNHHDLLDQAERFIDLALAELPDQPRLLGEAAHLQARRHHFRQAEALLDRALGLAPDEPALREHLALIYARTGRIAQALNLARSGPGDGAQQSRLAGLLTLVLNYADSSTPEEIFEVHRIWARGHEAPGPSPGPVYANVLDPGRKLRIGYLSPDFRRHSVAYFFEPLLRAHDRQRVELFCYSNVQKVDQVTERLRQLADHWRQIDQMPDAQACATIADDRIDLLVDLAGHTNHHRLPLFARRPAPLQLTWLGYPNTTGLQSIDYRLCDAVADPPGVQDHLYSERLWRLPHGFLCYAGAEIAPRPPAADPAPRPLTFGSFNSLAKVSDRTLALWSRVLAALPGARLLLKSAPLTDADIRDHLLARLAAHGIDSDAVELRGRVKDPHGHLRLYDRVDIALDTTPYNGTTTTCEALWMGVPVIVLRGDRHAARVGASLLTQAGLPELIAADDDDFVARAVALANDRERLRAYHAGLRARLAASTLCDSSGFARQVEAAYRQMWREYVARARPA